MTLQPRRLATRRRFRTWALATVGLFIVAVLITGAILVNRSSPAPSPSPTTTQTAHEAFLGLVTDAISVSGGDWTFADEKTPFSVRRALTHKREECLSDSSTEQYSLTLYGPAKVDPTEATKQMTLHWQGLGYSVRRVVATSDDIEIAATVPGGSQIGYFASTGVTSITAQGPCVTSAR